MLTRLAFIKNAALVSGGLFTKPSTLFSQTDAQRIGLQLYTLRNELGKDAKGTLAKVAALGYTDVETFGYNGKYWGLKPAELATTLKSLNLASSSGHYYPAESYLEIGWEDKLKGALDAGAALGQNYHVVPYLNGPFRTIENYKKFAEQFSKAADICLSRKITFAYHNHDFEFIKTDGQTGFDILLKADKKVKFEMDIYWVTKAGQDPIGLMKANPGRFPLWHVKDMDKTPNRSFTEVGNGVIDFKKIFANAKVAGMKRFFVEQDQTPGSPYDSIEFSIGYLKKYILK
ncbi:MAG: sugar phosphate isomerase/epimerase [Chitinophagaceae bacterium]